LHTFRPPELSVNHLEPFLLFRRRRARELSLLENRPGEGNGIGPFQRVDATLLELRFLHQIQGGQQIICFEEDETSICWPP
jgi:hypothetical protein